MRNKPPDPSVSKTVSESSQQATAHASGQPIC
eukprot:CAMPEP_0195062790 /NCGR_PEP_ID=MMETSP0448-20130528/9313_1 /TAXON_ID=66468 /ORGANISM="Heterocapsa triquestra, Strain CCMP 448" /LENGTH=31 /DNA_ID= /DNA_START= /DNA_END= /DNA_ORIENTATION=